MRTFDLRSKVGGVSELQTKIAFCLALRSTCTTFAPCKND